MRTEDVIRADLDAARAEYHERSQVAAAPELATRTAQIVALGAELSATIAAGANPCPKCKGTPAGMQKTPAITGRSPKPAVYEVGCGACGLRSRHWTAAGAVTAWNAGEHVG